MSNTFNNNVEALFGKMEGFVSSKTVVGTPVYVGDIVLLPLVDVAFAMGAGNMNKSEDQKATDNGGGGMGGRIAPSAVIIVQNGNVQMVNVKNQDSLNKLIDMAPGLLAKLNLDGIFGKKEDEKEETE